MTQQRIMEGVAALLRSSTNDVTFDLVARESGVAQRTLYRHFANKEALFGAFWRWVNDLIEMPALPASPEEVVAHIPALFAAFDRDEPLVRAMLHHPCGRGVRLAHAEARRGKFARALREITEALPDDDARQFLAAVTVLCSAAGWESMQDNWGLSGPATAKATQWAVQALIDAARRPSSQPPATAVVSSASIEGDNPS